MEPSWWFANDRNQVVEIKKLFLKSVYQYFLFHNINNTNLTTEAEAFKILKEALQEYYVILSKAFVSGKLDVHFEFPKTNKSDFDKIVRITDDENASLSSDCTKSGYNSPVTSFTELENGKSKAKQSYQLNCNDTTSKHTIDAEITRFSDLLHGKKASVETIQIDAISIETNSREIKGNLLDSKLDGKISNMYYMVCKLADKLQSGVYAKPFRNAFQVFHKMNTEK
ncbi:hypothetical protein BB560_000713 [Smittium megazygosporum]|nr:hypothetical protein BB560_000713 [Smittium megazygosporum]